jgi:hypothetical protein
MAIIKLQNEGESHTMTVTECKTVTGNYGEQVLFSDGTDTLYLPKTSADRQLERLGVDEASAVGMNLTFSRDPNPKKGAKPYWGISYAGAEPAQPKPSARVVPQAVPTTSGSVQPRRDAVLANYLLLWDAVAGHLAQTSQKYGYGLDAAAIQAATATVWISWKDKGIQPDGLPEAKPVEKAPEVKMPAPSGKRIAPPDFSKIPPPDDNDMDSELPF